MFEFALSANYLHSLHKDLDTKETISDRSQWDRILKNVYDRFFCENASQPVELSNLVSSANRWTICMNLAICCFLSAEEVWNVSKSSSPWQNPATWPPLATRVEFTQPMRLAETLQELRSELHDALRTVTGSHSPYSNDLLKRNKPLYFHMLHI